METSTSDPGNRAAPHQQPLHEYLRQHARERPEHPACLWYGRALSWAELDRASDAFGARLQTLGIDKGDPVVLFLNNCPQYLIAHFGIQKIGAIVCPCGPLNKAHELGYQLRDLQARAIVAAAALVPIVEQVRADSALQYGFVVHYGDLLPTTPSIDLPDDLTGDPGDDLTADLADDSQTAAGSASPRSVPEGWEDFLAATRSAAAPAPVPLTLDDIALMTYTSGTTGLPKGAMLSYRNALFKTAATAQACQNRADDVLLSIAPLYHIAGMLIGVNLPVFTGATAVLMHRFDPRATLQAIERHRVSWWYSIAPMNVACLADPEIDRFNLDSLRLNPVTSFGITFTETLAAQWRGHARHCASQELAYGLSETHTCDTLMPPEAVRWGTHGKAAPGVSIRIIDPNSGQLLPAGEAGEILVSSPGVFKGYWNKPEATAATLREGWVHTGDMGRLDADGYLTFMGRFKEMIKVSGYSVFPEEVEAILVRHPGVAQAAVIGVSDPVRGEIVQAFIVRRAGVDSSAEGIIAWSRENMAAYKVPRAVHFIDALPATGAGKVLRRLLKDRA